MRRRAASGFGCAILAMALGVGLPAAALVVDSINPETQESPPPRDPGWSNVGRRASTSAVYLGDGWVISARHSGLGPVLFDGVSYSPVPGSDVVLGGPDADTPADLLMFRIAPVPDLPGLRIARKMPGSGTRIVYIAWGHGRGDPTTRDGVDGFLWRTGFVKRWGTNRIYVVKADVRGPHSVTRCFQTDFSRHGTRNEAQGATGDSGGAAFVRRRGRWMLAGILLSIGASLDQQPGVALFGNLTNSADLSFYRKQIRAVMEKAREAPPGPGASAPGGPDPG